MQKVKVKRECERNRVNKREKGKEKQKMKKVGMIRKKVDWLLGIDAFCVFVGASV